MVEEAQEIFYVEAGRRRTIHRGVVADGAPHVATERCNLDDAGFKPRRVDDADAAKAREEGRMCGWCFPKETR